MRDPWPRAKAAPLQSAPSSCLITELLITELKSALPDAPDILPRAFCPVN